MTADAETLAREITEALERTWGRGEHRYPVIVAEIIAALSRREAEIREEPLAMLRAEGWMVAVHNDYRLNGEAHTFWLFTHPNGRWIKGEGRTDAEAIAAAIRSLPLSTGTPPPGCHCQPGKCMAPRIMGHQTACRDPAKAALIDDPEGRN